MIPSFPFNEKYKNNHQLKKPYKDIFHEIRIKNLPLADIPVYVYPRLPRFSINISSTKEPLGNQDTAFEKITYRCSFRNNVRCSCDDDCDRGEHVWPQVKRAVWKSVSVENERDGFASARELCNTFPENEHREHPLSFVPDRRDSLLKARC